MPDLERKENRLSEETDGSEREAGIAETKYSRLERALNRTEEHLRQSQKMEAVGILAGGIAHDFNNILTAIIGFSDLALQKMPQDDPLRKDIIEVREAGGRAAELTGQLLAFSRKQNRQPVVLNLNKVISNIHKMLRRIMKESIEIRLSLQDNVGNIKADPGQLEQVIMNLAVNGRDSMPKGGTLLIETSSVYLDEEYVSQHHSVSPGRFVKMTVSDNGEGMDAMTRSRIFEPFFTTKEFGKGTGLGLSTVYGIVKQSGGDLNVHSELGHGTTFEIYLPCVDENVEIPLWVAPDLGKYFGTETIILVEDEAMVRNLVREVLTPLGFNVLEAANGKEALELCDKFPETIHMLLTDVVMPQLGGIELASMIRKVHPNIRILFMSGYLDGSDTNRTMFDPEAEFIAKPFSPDALIKKVKSVLAHQSKYPASMKNNDIVSSEHVVEKESTYLEKSPLLSAIRVLAIDDDPQILTFHRNVLEALGCSVVMATTDSQALRVAEQFDAEIIISDYLIAGMDSREMLRELRTIRPSAISILITNAPDRNVVRSLFREFDFTYLRKPISDIELQQILELAVGRRDAMVRERRNDDFLSIISHELREPLQGPLTFLGNFLAGTYGFFDEHQRDRLQRISRGLQTEKRLVNNLLDLSYMEAGRFAIEKVEASFKDLLNEVVESLEMQASDKNVKIECAVPDNPCLIFVDGDHIKQALGNVLVNAINHAPSGTQVKVEVERRGDKLEAVILNEGEIIPQQYVKSIFDKGFQIPSKKKKKRGLGIGLFIAKEIVVAHDGDILTETRDRNRTAFRISLPI